jgi:hypothetical protein
MSSQVALSIQHNRREELEGRNFVFAGRRRRLRTLGHVLAARGQLHDEFLLNQLKEP